MLKKRLKTKDGKIDKWMLCCHITGSLLGIIGRYTIYRIIKLFTGQEKALKIMCVWIMADYIGTFFLDVDDIIENS